MPCRFAKKLVPSGEMTPSFSHHFITILERNRKLLRNYTQNIDGLEAKAGISRDKIVECHGSMNEFQCIKCKKRKFLEDLKSMILEGQVCLCDCGEVLKPMITFFGEFVPKSFMSKAYKDIEECDLLLVMGTSLKVGGTVDEIIKGVNNDVPQILINRESVRVTRGKNADDVSFSPKKEFSMYEDVYEFLDERMTRSRRSSEKFKDKLTDGFDVELLGDCDEILSFLCRLLEWDRHTGNPRKRKKRSGSTGDDIDARREWNEKIVNDRGFDVLQTSRRCYAIKKKENIDLDQLEQEELQAIQELEALESISSRKKVKSNDRASSAREVIELDESLLRRSSRIRNKPTINYRHDEENDEDDW